MHSPQKFNQPVNKSPCTQSTTSKSGRTSPAVSVRMAGLQCPYPRAKTFQGFSHVLNRTLNVAHPSGRFNWVESTMFCHRYGVLTRTMISGVVSALRSSSMPAPVHFTIIAPAAREIVVVFGVGSQGTFIETTPEAEWFNEMDAVDGAKVNVTKMLAEVTCASASTGRRNSKASSVHVHTCLYSLSFIGSPLLRN